MDTKKSELEKLLSSVNSLSDHINEATTDLSSLKNSLKSTDANLTSLKSVAVTQSELAKVTPSISDAGYWKIGGVDTGILARGVNGTDGVDGKDGKDGEKGDKGDKGDQGVSISTIKNYYKKSSKSSGETIGDGWSESIPTLDSLNKYLWNYEVVYNSNGIIFSQSNPCVIGSLGADGVGIESIVDYYGLSASADAEPIDWSTEVKTITAELKCLWNYEVITYSNGESYTTNKSVIGTYGRDGEDGVSISSVEEWYLASANKTGVNVNTSGWSTSIPTLTEINKYLWNYEKIYDSKGNIINTIAPSLIGSLGDSGANGRGIKSIAVIEYYKVLSISSAVTLPSGLTCGTDGDDDSDDEINSDKANITKAGWSTEMQVTTDTNKYLWNFEMAIYTFDDGNKNVTYTDPAIIGTKGDVGNGVESIESKYAVSATTSVPADSEFTTTYKTPDADHKYLWEKTRTKYTDGTYAVAINSGWTDAHIIGVFGKDGSDADVNFANCCSALGITSDTSGSGIYQQNGKLAINADVILTDDLFATRIKSVDIEAENLKVSSANITGKISANSIEIKNSNGATVMKADASYPDQTVVGGFTVDSTSLKSGLKSFDDTDTAKGVYVGTDGIKVGQNFYVDANGNVTAKTLRTITKVETTYASSTSGTTVPASGWNSDITKITLSTYTWTRTITTYSTNESDTKYSVAKNGNDGEDGNDGNTWLPSLDSSGNLSWKIDKTTIAPTTTNIKGPQGADGVGIKSASIVDGKLSIVNTKNVTLVDAVQVKGDDGLTPEITQSGNILTVKLGGVQKFNADLKGEQGEKGERGEKGDQGEKGATGEKGDTGETGKGISSIVTYYALSSTTATPTSGWDATAKTPTEDNKYLWEKTRTTYSDGTYSISTNDGWTDPHIVGVFGKDGSDADVNFANCCSALGITTDTSGSGIYQQNNKLAINADVILTDDLFANKIKSVDIEAENLKVKMANVDGTLNANKITITADDENTIYDAYSTSGKYTCIYNTNLSSYTMINGKFFGEAVLSTVKPYFRDAGISTYSEKPYGTYPDTSVVGGVGKSNGESYATNYYARGICYTHKTFDSDGNQLTTGSYTLMLPDKSGTIATTDDIKAATGTDMSSYLTTTTASQTYAAKSHTHAISDITDLATTLSGKASSSHSHTISDVTGLSTALSGKASSSHTHFTEVSLGYKDLLSAGSILTFLNKLCDATTIKNVYLHCSGLPYVSLYYDVITGDYALYASGTMYNLETMQKISGFVDKIVGIVYIA